MHCIPFKHSKENIYLAINESQIIQVQIDGDDTYIIDEAIKEVIQRLDIDCNKYEEWHDIYILLEKGWKEIWCNECPWYDECEAMDKNNK